MLLPTDALHYEFAPLTPFYGPRVDFASGEGDEDKKYVTLMLDELEEAY